METFNTALQCSTFVIPWNAVMLALGILTSVIVAEILVKKRRLYKDLALDCCIIAIPSGVVGARLFSAISGKIAWADLLKLSEIGLNLYGAVLFASIGGLIYCAIRKLDVGEVSDVFAPAVFFGLAVGRWSDFFLCDGLGPTAKNVPEFFPLVTFTKLYFVDHSTVAYAVFFLDFLVCAALGITALLLLKKRIQTGKCARITFVLYILAAFAIEWLRDGSTRQIVFGEVRFNQIVLLGMLILLIAVSVIRAKKRAAKTVEPAAEAEPESTETDAEQGTEIQEEEPAK